MKLILRERRSFLFEDLLLALAAALIVLIFFAPRFVVWRGLGIPDLLGFPELNRAADALRQLKDPLAPIANPSNRVLEWRLLFPSLGSALRLPGWLYLALPSVGCLAALALVGGRLRVAGWRRDEALAVLLLVGSGPWFFVSTGWLAYFDSWLVLALLVVVFGSSRWTLAAAVALAPWIDERFLFVLPACLVVRAWCRARWALPVLGAVRPWSDWKTAAVALAPFLAVRLGAAVFGAGGDGAVWRELLAGRSAEFPWGGALAGVWEGLRFGWLALAVFAVRAARSSPGNRHHAGLLALAVVAALGVMLRLAADFSRSAGVLMPLLPAVLMLGWWRPDGIRRGFVWCLAGLNLLLPAHHVVNAERVAVRSLWHEWTAWRSPPELLRADRHNVRATELLLAGRPEEALVPLRQALQLEADFLPAVFNLSRALCQLGRGPEALAAAERALVLDPRHPRAWYLRAEARRLTGDPRGARADLDRAESLAPPGDPLRAQIDSLRAGLRRGL
jgi:tetratricopeptide (TPR) repeat protein